MQMFRELAPGCKATCGLSNVSNGTPGELRGLLNCTYLMMLEKYGLTSAIVDAFDFELVKIAKGEKENLKKIVWQVMDGEEPDISNFSPEEVNYLKTTKVLLGLSLYSHSWLKL